MNIKDDADEWHSTELYSHLDDANNAVRAEMNRYVMAKSEGDKFGHWVDPYGCLQWWHSDKSGANLIARGYVEIDQLRPKGCVERCEFLYAGDDLQG